MSFRRQRINSRIAELLKETPERPHVPADIEKQLSAAGHQNVNHLGWRDMDAVTFAIDTKYHVGMWLSNGSDSRSFSHADFDDFFTGGYKDTGYAGKGVVGMDWKKYKILAKWHAGKFSDGDNNPQGLLLGRMWTKARFVSFWCKKDEAQKEIKVITNLIFNAGLNPKKCLFEFIDQNEPCGFDDFVTPAQKAMMVAESIARKTLTEDPDSLTHTDIGDEQKMKSLGIDVQRLKSSPPGHWDFDSIPFVYDLENDVVVFSKRTNHSEEPLVHSDLSDTLGIYYDNPDMFTVTHLPYGWTITPDDTNEKWDDAAPNSQTGPVSFVHLGTKDAVDKYIKDGYPVLDIPSRQNSKFVMGRLWDKAPVISFWAQFDRVVNQKSMRGILDFLKALSIDPKKTMYEFVDHDRLFFADELSSMHKEKLSKDAIADKMAKQHLDPNAKRDLTGDEYIQAHMKKHGQGHDFAAMANARKQTSDGRIRVGKTINEDPDVSYINGDTDNSRSFSDNDAFAFFHFTKPNFTAWIKQGTHEYVIRVMAAIKLELENNFEDVTELIRAYHDDMLAGAFLTSYIDDHRKEMSATVRGINRTVKYSGETVNLLRFLYSDQMDNLSKLTRDWDDFRANTEFAIQGRVWTDTPQLISFWIRTDEVRDLIRAGSVKPICQNIGLRYDNTLYVCAGDNDDAFPIKQFMGDVANSKLSDEEYRALLAKQHLDPEAKKKLGGDEVVMKNYKKHGQGYDFAALANARKQTSDGEVKDGALLKEDPEDLDIKAPSGKTAHVSYTDGDSRSFLYNPKYNVFIMADDNQFYHYEIVDMLVAIGEASVKATENNSQFYCPRIEIDGNTITVGNDSLRFVGSEANLRKFAEYAFKTEAFGEFDDRGEVSLYGFLGRAWIRKNVISFWCISGWLKKMIETGILEKTISLCKLSKQKPLYIDFVDTTYATTYEETMKGETSDEKLSDKEVKALQAKQHLDPEAKRKLTGDEFIDQHMKKHGQGHDFAAIANARKQTSDSIERDDDRMIDESPDRIENEHGTWSFKDPDAQTFIYFPPSELLFVSDTVSGGGKRMYHYTIVGVLEELSVYITRENLKSGEELRTWLEINQSDIQWDPDSEVITSDRGDIRYIGNEEKVFEYIKKIQHYRMDKVEPNASDDDSGSSTYRRNLARIGVSGRYWSDTEVSSFWLSKEELRKLVKSGSMNAYFKYMSLSVDNARVNTMEDNQIVVAGELAQTPHRELSAAEKQDKAAAVHLDPKAKDGLRHDYKMKRHDHDVEAKANFYARQSDGVIKLGDLLK